jgi:hypothetical protein
LAFEVNIRIFLYIDVGTETACFHDGMAFTLEHHFEGFGDIVIGTQIELGLFNGEPEAVEGWFEGDVGEVE